MMTFFCAKCQKRHDVKDISADLWEICKEDIVSGLETLTDRMKGESFAADQDAENAISDLRDNLTVFIREGASAEECELKEKFKSLFALNPGNAARLRGARREENTIFGTYCVSLDELFQLYTYYSPKKINEMIIEIIGIVPKEWFDKPVCEKEIKVCLDANGAVDKVTDNNNIPFARGTKMLGFQRICPHCGRTLSRAVGRAEEIVVALAGSPRAGKSSCMVAMASSLIGQNNLGIRVVPLPHDDAWESMEEEIELYQKCRKVTKTPDVQKEVPSHSMLLEINDRVQTKRVLTIVDMPGEFWQVGEGLTADFFKQYSGLYENIDCIWFVTSKATVRLSQNQIPDHVRKNLNDQTSEDADVIFKANPSNLEKNFGTLKSHLDARGKPMPPTLVVLSKPDFMVSDIDEQITIDHCLFPQNEDVVSRNAEELSKLVRHDTSRLYGVNEIFLYRHSKDVREYIQDSNPQFLRAIENNCEDRFYAAVSAYGQPAVDNEMDYRRPTPYHELYPLLWTLAITGGTKVYHKCSWLTTGVFGNIKDTQDTEEGVLFPHSQTEKIIASAKSRQKADDLGIVYNDLKSNLFMHGDEYAKTIIRHKRG